MFWVVFFASLAGLVTVSGGWWVGYYMGRNSGAKEAMTYTLKSLGRVAPGFRKRLVRKLMNDANPR